MYHRISSDDCPVVDENTGNARYSVAIKEFRWQMDYLKARGVRGVSVGDIVAHGKTRLEGGGRVVVLTFDDGNRSDFEHALPILNEKGFTATFFITGNRVGVSDGLDEGMIRGLCRSGMEVGSHGTTHRFLSELSELEQQRECDESRRLLGEITGTRIRCFSLPGGRYNKTTMAILRSGSYEAVCTSRFGYTASGSDSFGLRRIPIMRTTNRRLYRGIIERLPHVVALMCLKTESPVLIRRILGETAYEKLRSTFIRE